ncbi:uncharacterized protein LOC130657494 [Hydractinia symbiolongicarpus]|uniref:uncharacterized protein LOC130657494 n=1 Tax=Hydractinia symbiolongicarpus TaxID=13093 RepID=UPI00254C5B17|nr:uncharacterized protein LOC130657494 [Hydractinia symbiolongicarpus]
MEMTAVRKSLSLNEKLIEAEKAKNAGNSFYKDGNLQKAIKKYHISLLYLKDVEKPSPLDKLSGTEPEEISEELLDDIFKLRCSCYNNLSAVMLKKKNYEKVITYATEVLTKESKNVKAFFRRGQAYYATKNIEKAEDDFLAIKQIDSSESCADRFFPLIDAAKKKQLASEKEMCRKMMSNG